MPWSPIVRDYISTLSTLITGEKNKRWITLSSNKTQMASRLSSDTFAPFFEIFAMQITVRDSFGYTNIYVCHAK